MTDYFSLLDEPRRPWLEPETLRGRFLALCAEVHPDRVHGDSPEHRQAANQRYAELNAAYQCLREPRARLQHLIELESGRKPKDIQPVSPGTMELFLEISRVCREVDEFLETRAKVTSPLLKVQLFERAQEWTSQLRGIQTRINVMSEALSAELKVLNERWDARARHGSGHPAESMPLARLEELYPLVSYVARWSAQIQERIVQLSF